MSRFLLFTGDKAVGKTTALRRVVEEVGAQNFVGFTAGERRSCGERTGFDIAMLDGRSGPLASVEFESGIRVGGLNSAGVPRYGVDLSFLDDVAVPELMNELQSSSPRVLVVDEIGPMQLHSESFREAIVELLQRPDVIVIGTVVLRSFPWTDDLKTNSRVACFLLTVQNRDVMAEMMALYLNRLIGSR